MRSKPGGGAAPTHTAPMHPCTHVAARRHAHVRPLRVALHRAERAGVVAGALDAGRHGAVQRRRHRLLHRSLPGGGNVGRDVDRPLVRRHLRARRPQRGHQHRGARQPGAQRDALPRRTRVRRVQQDGRLPHDPTLLARKRDGVEPVVDVLVGGGGAHAARLPRAAPIRSLKQRLTRAQQEPALRLVRNKRQVEQDHLGRHRQLHLGT